MINKHEICNTTVILLLLAMLCGACHSFYKVHLAKSDTPGETARSIDSLHQKNRYFILRSGNDALAMSDYVLSADRSKLHCRLSPLPLSHLVHLSQGVKRKEQYRRNDANNRAVVQEVHFFTLYDTALRIGTYSLSLDRVQRIEVIEHDKKRTTNSYVIGALGYTLGAAVIAGVIIAATKSSCPFVSAYTDGQFVLQGEIYGGAIYPQLARPDYMPLKMSPTPGGNLQLKISNELQERQYTDMANLQVITHDTAIKIWTDQDGNLYPVSKPQPPVAAMLNQRKSVMEALKESGDFNVLFMDDSSASDARNDLVLTFNKPTDLAGAKLLLKMKNSYWLDFLYGELAKGFGDYYPTYIKEQRTKPAAELMKWVNEQQIPLRVAIREEGEWKDISSITTIGPLANRELVIPIEFASKHETHIEIKLSSGFMFWEIDYAALDFTPRRKLDVEVISPYKAFDEMGKDVLPLLQKEDGIYLDQPQIGNSATILYKYNHGTHAGKTQTYILHTKGYYEHIREYKNKPDLLFLSQFKKPNAFPLFGMRLYQQQKDRGLQVLATTTSEK